MAESRAAMKRGSFGATLRRDAWWIEALPVILLLGGFGIYATLRAFEGKYYEVEGYPYLSPFYSPLIDPNHNWWPLSPALLILGAPLGFRLTCYYYRKAYYRSFFMSPPACAVEPGRRRYRGETAFPFILQNLHRYFLYLALIVLVVLWYDAIVAFIFNGQFGIRVGSLIFLVNVVLLSFYTFSCHSLRHLVGGKADCFSCSAFGKPQYSAWRITSILNERHMLFAWSSLISVGLTDLYVRLLATGVIEDLRIL